MRVKTLCSATTPISHSALSSFPRGVEIPRTRYGDLIPARDDLQSALKDKARQLMRKAHLPDERTSAPGDPEIFIYVGDSQSEPVRGTLRGLFKGTLHVASCESVAASSAVMITFGDAGIRGVVEYCNWKRNHFLISIAVSSLPEARRRDFRLPCHQKCSMAVLGDVCVTKCEALITDISASGMGLQVPRRIAVGTMACVQADRLVAAGRVLRCDILDNGNYAAGIELTDILWGEKKAASSWRNRVRAWWMGFPHIPNQRGSE
jgi:hypothetical protein